MHIVLREEHHVAMGTQRFIHVRSSNLFGPVYASRLHAANRYSSSTEAEHEVIRGLADPPRRLRFEMLFG